MKKVVLYRINKEQRGDKIVKLRMLIDSAVVESDDVPAAVADFTETADIANLKLEESGSWDRYEVLVLEADGTEARG